MTKFRHSKPMDFADSKMKPVKRLNFMENSSNDDDTQLSSSLLVLTFQSLTIPFVFNGCSYFFSVYTVAMFGLCQFLTSVPRILETIIEMNAVPTRSQYQLPLPEINDSCEILCILLT